MEFLFLKIIFVFYQLCFLILVLFNFLIDFWIGLISVFLWHHQFYVFYKVLCWYFRDKLDEATQRLLAKWKFSLSFLAFPATKFYTRLYLIVIWNKWHIKFSCEFQCSNTEKCSAKSRWFFKILWNLIWWIC